jgi:phosphoribosylformylglycinamidine synthase
MPEVKTLEAGTRHGLNAQELTRILEILGHEPSELELGLFSLNWSEHCSYKSSKRFLKKLPTQSRRVLQGPGENAGVVMLDDELGVAFKVESHNHPSAVEPFNGAATGIGGIIRDILAMGAHPIALLDSLRFGELADSKSSRLFEGVVAGIAHYGNCVGIPTVGGEVYFEETYADNPLVNVLCVGLLRKDGLKHAVARGVGNPILLVGARTGRDGIHGATFASADLLGETEEKRPNVQVGDPFMAKLLIEATLTACADSALIGLQDLGAGGLSTAIPEMAARGAVGIEIELDQVPLRTRPMSPYEILLSESQERMVLCVNSGSEERFINTFRKWGLSAAVIGRVIADKILRVTQSGEPLTEIPLAGLVGGPPESQLAMHPPQEHTLHLPSKKREAPRRATSDWKSCLLDLLASPSIGSRRPIYQQYDYTVQINTVVAPGAGDAAVLRVKGTSYGLAMTIDGNGRYCQLDPYEGAMIAICEAARNIVAVGAEPLGITDGLNFADPNDPEVYWTFARAIEGLSDASRALGIPFVSGNVSFYNQSERCKIYPTPIVGMVGLLKDIRKRVPMGFQHAGDRIYRVGRAEGAIGGSEFLKLFYGDFSDELDHADLAFERRLLDAMLELAKHELIQSAHDISEGGLLIAIAESALTGGCGVQLELKEDFEEALYGEWQSRFVISVRSDQAKAVEQLLNERGLPWSYLGQVSDDLTFCLAKDAVTLDALCQAYESALKGCFS